MDIFWLTSKKPRSRKSERMNMHILSDFLGRGSAMLDITSDETSNLSKAHETRDSLNSSYFQVVLIYFYPF